MRIAALLLTVAVATLSGCTTIMMVKPRFNPLARTVTCVERDCALPVTVTENADRTCSVDVAEHLDVRGGPAGQRGIRWTLATEGYEFSREAFKFGLFIKSDPLDEFKNVQVTENGTTLTIQFGHQRSGIDYAYALTVRRRDGTWCKTLDPWLIT